MSTPCLKASRTKPLWPPKSTRWRSDQGRKDSQLPPGQTATLRPAAKMRWAFSWLARTAPSMASRLFKPGSFQSASWPRLWMSVLRPRCS